jgi:outer membrane autotransporter protein
MHGSTGGGGADPVVPSAQEDDNGVWARIIGFGADRDVSYTTEPFPDQFVTVDADYSERMGAIQGGIDHAFDSGSGSFVVGLLAGYAYNNIDFDDAGDTAKISAPHVGAYASWISDGTYVSGLIKADFLNVDYDLVGLGEQASTDGYSLGGRVEAGHRFQMGRAFIEPVASLAYVHTSLDNITAGGTDITFNDGSSLRGKIGARLGFTSMTASGQFDPYVHAYVGNEFLGDNSAFFASGPGLTVTDDVSGIFGEVGGGFNYLTTDRRTSIYGQANYIFADGYQAGNVKLGVRMNW